MVEFDQAVHVELDNAWQAPKVMESFLDGHFNCSLSVQ